MCFNNFHIILFYDCHLTTIMIFFLLILEFSRYILVLVIVLFYHLYVVFFTNNRYQSFWFDPRYDFLVCSMVAALSNLARQKRRGGVLKELLSCNYMFHCIIWGRENSWKNCFLPVKNSTSQRYVDTIKITPGVRLQWLKNFLPTWKLHHKFLTWFSTCEYS